MCSRSLFIGCQPVMLTRNNMQGQGQGQGPSLQGPGLDLQGQGLDPQGPGQGQGLKFGP